MKAAILIPWLVCYAPSAPEDGKGTALAQAIRTAYEANRTAFPFGDVRFRYAVGRTSSMKDALQGKWASRHVADGRYAYDNQRAVFSCEFPLDAMISDRVRSGDEWVSSLSSTRVLTDGVITLKDRINVARDGASLSHQPQIFPGTELFYGEVICPLDLGSPLVSLFHVGQDIEKSAGPSKGLTLDLVEDDVSDGRDVAHLAFSGDGKRRDYWIDIERNAVPVRIEMSPANGSEPPIIQVVYDDVQPVEERGWLPRRMTVRFDDGMTKQFVMQRSDFAHRPDPSTFRLTFPKALPIINTATMVRYAPQKEWDLARLPSPSSPQSRRITISTSGPPVASLPGERDTAPAWITPVILTGLALMAVATWRYRRKRGEYV